MAGQAAKKLARTASVTSQYYFYITLASTAAHVLLKILWGFSSCTKWHLMGSVFLFIVARFCYGAISEASALGVPYSFYQDVFIVNTAVQLLSIVSDYFWLLYLTVPAYGFYKAFDFLKAWIFAPGTNETDPSQVKKQQKLERKIRQGRVIMRNS